MANRLIKELSPYLQQHANNPVDWYPWCDEAFERARKESKPVLVSIGYAACHWCHVMERESFENEDTATFMNAHFVNIKVDREERPDVDHLYMDALQAISGSGGWPLNVFVTPDRAPFYGGTYYPPVQAYNRPSWLQLLGRIHKLWVEQNDEVHAQSNQLLQHLQQASMQSMASTITEVCSKEVPDEIGVTLLQQADKEWGGFGHAPKFPGTMAVSYLLEHYHFTGNEDALQQALLSLDKMMEGGIYDQLGGGFSRYSTDEKWLAPHFEKMLYDNALLVLSYCDAYAITKNEKYKRVIEETIAFADRELKAPEGVYCSALDADSEGVEGKFYTWHWAEWQAFSGDKDGVAAAYFGISEEGNWEHTNILHLSRSISSVAEEKGYSGDAVSEHILKVKINLLKQRAQRIRPITDDKSLLSWNALMNLALSRAGSVLKNEQLKNAALTHMQAMMRCFKSSQELYHVWKKGQKKVAANLDDYAYLISAMLQLASVCDESNWLLEADKLVEVALNDFLHESGNFFYYNSVKQQDIPVRKVDKYDGAMPSANAVMTQNLMLLGLCMEKHAYIEQARFQLNRMVQITARYAYSFAYWGIVMQRYIEGFKTIICSGNNADNVRNTLSGYLLPHCYLLTSKKEISDIPILNDKFLQSETHIFVCTETACMPAVADIQSVLRLVQA